MLGRGEIERGGRWRREMVKEERVGVRTERVDERREREWEREEGGGRKIWREVRDRSKRGWEGRDGMDHLKQSA